MAFHYIKISSMRVRETRIIIVLFLSICIHPSYAQDLLKLTGKVLGVGESQQEKVLSGASIEVFPGRTGAISDEKGRFLVAAPPFARYLIASYPGYQADSILIGDRREFEIRLRKDFRADSVVIEGNKASSSVDPFKAQLSEILDQKELLKAACCNLGESFSTNASVDVQFDDALTGSKQIELLGLAGPYTQISIESMPGIRGIASRIGLDLIPGPWISSIQIAKGAGSVVNGYEGFVGQINVEWEKPQTGRRLYLNGYGNIMGRAELNLNTTHQLTEGIGTTLLLHGSLRPMDIDRNQDGFLDIPRSRQLNLVNRWYFSNEKNLQSQLGIQVVNDNKEFGQIDGDIQGIFETNQTRIWAKIGWVNPQRSGESLGLQLMYQAHDQQNEVWGLELWDKAFEARQNTAYANLIYQNYISSPSHSIRIGTSFQLDQLSESLPQIEDKIEFMESVPGFFGEYTYKYKEKVRLVAGLRGDFHNIWGFFLTPRLHFLFKPDSKSSIRISGGRGQRTANVYAENLGRLLNQRSLVAQSESPYLNKAYGFPAEIGWNGGINISRDFRVNYRPVQLRMEYFLTWFEQLTVVDMENPRSLEIYPLEGEAFAQSFLTEAKVELHRRFEVRAAYKFQRTQIDYQGGRLDRPFLPRHRAFLNAAYSTRNKWSFDATGQFIGQQRLPSTIDNPQEYQREAFSPSFFQVHAQVSKVLSDRWEVYVGGENLLNFRQENPILAANGNLDYFDASLIWGPVAGRMVYGGFRFIIEERENK